MNKKIIIVGGDPNSINSEIIYKVWKKLNYSTRKNLYFIANYNLFLNQFKKIGIKLQVDKITNLNDKLLTNNLNIIDIPIKYKNPFKVSLKESSKYVLRSLEKAHFLVKNKFAKAIINCPIDKKLIKKSNKIGVTEFFASKCKVKKSTEVMFLHNKKLSVVPLTTHIRINDVPKNISISFIYKKIISLNKEFKKLFKFKPKIGIIGLNPHNSEFNKSSEEIRYILPAIKRLKKKGLKIYGPLVTDTIFIQNYKKFDVIVGMYHDQVLSPFKTLFKFDAINITLGLDYLRASPDHGPAVDLIGKNKADSSSLLQCIKFIKTKI
tara:strand:- start:1628 stop:2593 length:966 start_codon:yes stop_codon:yes gene_type:complete